jgi:hypothetical protein
VDPNRGCYAEINCHAVANAIKKLRTDLVTFNGESIMFKDPVR